MKVTITKAQLEAAKACPAYLKSPEWDGKALVYTDWAATAKRLASTSQGLTYLDFLVVSGLVPMTRAEYKQVRDALFRERGALL